VLYYLAPNPQFKKTCLNSLLLMYFSITHLKDESQENLLSEFIGITRPLNLVMKLDKIDYKW
jgi:hypothetical protein